MKIVFISSLPWNSPRSPSALDHTNLRADAAKLCDNSNKAEEPDWAKGKYV